MINTIDLFAGCGGLTEGFLQTGYYRTLAVIEWDNWPLQTLKHRLANKYNYSNVDELAFMFDIQRIPELINGWNDIKYGSSPGLKSLKNVNRDSVHMVIGGPPCQAYSIAGRIRDKHGMRFDYRNYLFESYLEIVRLYQPDVFVFENVPGLLSARPGNFGKNIVDDIQDQIERIGYHIISDLKQALIDFTEYGIPQQRKRVIIVGLNKTKFGVSAESLLQGFYLFVLPSFKEALSTVKSAIFDLPKLFPLAEHKRSTLKSHTENPSKLILNHNPRWHSDRDIEVFRLLAEDIETGENRFTSTEALKKLYTELTGKKSNVHKYNVLRWNEPSNTIPAHLYKDGLRHIHPDSMQARTITVREAARLQTFPDDFEFISNTNHDYKMIGNAVPPKFSKKLALALKIAFFDHRYY